MKTTESMPKGLSHDPVTQESRSSPQSASLRGPSSGFCDLRKRSSQERGFLRKGG